MSADPNDPRYFDTLRRAWTPFSGADERWAALAARGATDEQLTAHLEFELGLGGGSSGPDWLHERHSGHPPRIWISETHVWSQEKPDYSGARLLALARRIFGIGLPAEAGQLSFSDLPVEDSFTAGGA